MQSQQIEFETPENIAIRYELAGPGTRFVAWFTDQLLMFVLLLVVVVILMIVGAISGSMMEAFRKAFVPGRDGKFENGDAAFYMLGLITLAIGFFSFLYYGAQELFLRGQTIGKRTVSLGVAKADGFTLDAGSILIRNLFRVIDHLPPLWIVPLFSQKGQRLGDMVAGTVVVVHRRPERDARTRIMDQGKIDRQFRFDAVRLRRLTTEDFMAAEKIYRRARELKPEEADPILLAACAALATKIGDEAPAAEWRLRYLEELLAVEYARQNRNLG